MSKLTMEQLVAKQQLEIENLKLELQEYVNAENNIRSRIYCVSGPLNGNRLGYTREQMTDFWAINNELKGN